MRWREETEDVITVAFHEVQSDRKILTPVNDWSTGAGGNVGMSKSDHNA